MPTNELTKKIRKFLFNDCACMFCLLFVIDCACMFCLLFCGLVTCLRNNLETEWGLFLALIALCGWLGWKHQLTNEQSVQRVCGTAVLEVPFKWGWSWARGSFNEWQVQKMCCGKKGWSYQDGFRHGSTLLCSCSLQDWPKTVLREDGLGQWCIYMAIWKKFSEKVVWKEG